MSNTDPKEFTDRNKMTCTMKGCNERGCVEGPFDIHLCRTHFLGQIYKYKDEILSHQNHWDLSPFSFMGYMAEELGWIKPPRLQDRVRTILHSKSPYVFDLHFGTPITQLIKGKT